MRLIILAAGRGSRLGSMTNKAPKILKLYRGKSLLEWHLLHIREAGFLSEINVVGGFKSEELSNFPINLIVNNNWAQANIGSSLIAADHLLSEGETLVIYGDIYYEPDLISQVIKSPTPTVVSVENWLQIWSRRMLNPLEDLESFRVNDKDELMEIGRRVSSTSEIQGQFAGIFSIDSKTWCLMKQVENASQMDCTSLIQRLIDLGCKFRTIQYGGMWREFDLPIDFLD